MLKVTLGNTGVQVSAFCLGGMYLGTKQNQSESFSLLDQYYEAGGSFIDTANIYAHWIPGGRGGESETTLGNWIRERENRHNLFIASKVGFGYMDIPSSLNADIIESECNKSLKRMGVETIDLYYAHHDDRSTQLEETLEAFYKLRKSGKVRFFGASNYLAWRLEEAGWISRSKGWPEYCCIQQRHTYIRKKPGTSFDPQIPVNEDLLDFCRNRKITLLAYSALLSGAYTRDDRPISDQYQGPDTNNRINVLVSVAKDVNAAPNQVILAWMHQSDPLVIPLIAASTSEQLRDNLDALTIQLSPDHMTKLNEAGPV